MIYPHQIGFIILIIVFVLFIVSIKYRKLLPLSFLLLMTLVVYEGLIIRFEYSNYKEEYNNIVGEYQLSLDGKWTTINVFEDSTKSKVDIRGYKGLKLILTEDKVCKISQKTPFFDDTIGRWQYNFFDDRPLIYIDGYKSCQFGVGKNSFSTKGGFVLDSIRYSYQLYFNRIKKN